MKLELPDTLAVEYNTNPHKGRRWTLQRPFIFLIDSAEIVIPKGFWTDFASIPSLFWPLLDPYDLGRAPVVHDFLYFAGYQDDRNLCDEVFLEAMRIDGVNWFARNAAFQAVSWFGGWAWANYRKVNLKHYIALRGGRLTVSNWSDRKNDSK